MTFFSPSYCPNSESRHLQTALQFPDVFKPRQEESHKGTFGTLAVIGGTSGMSGAVVLAATAAMYTGCGKTWAAFNQPQLPFAVIPERPEVMLATAETLIRRNDIDAYVVGCGLGLDTQTEHLLSALLTAARGKPLLLDADALTLLAKPSAIRQQAAEHGKLILTPHPSEAARLLGISTEAVQSGREHAVQTISHTFNAVTVLKGSRSLVAAPEQPLYTNTSGNAGLATAGSGDVLSGIIGSLLAQGIPLLQAAQAGVWLHGAAADLLRDNGIGEAGMLAGEIAPAARWLRNRLIHSSI
ncbi:NAD(P)H-hydrate dehydratase [Neisseria animalis]|uniref:ADP-dependent (S)-NAD(P)H-hydrate dehydratase n=1 Tax=Neisseria animalis TaxID=492 RepID=A0A5P3MUL4_NEIAN|nr:NAD(P)H-hydrate dehydratase [Neisseria animalis]QEY24755.1 NAD(P)H-hydrate dehydratase [Neisseria animalis]ROW31845.1 NAD(P)H-hydrate dehydratase [Neisseria animalis]VEE07783.1 putative carbohydrate kinase [Neisseria animalis]